MGEGNDKSEVEVWVGMRLKVKLSVKMWMQVRMMAG